jgi:hypothetical protein
MAGELSIVGVEVVTIAARDGENWVLVGARCPKSPQPVELHTFKIAH